MATYLSLKKISWNNYFELADINHRYYIFCQIAQPLQIISKPKGFKLCHMKLRNLKVDPISDH